MLNRCLCSMGFTFLVFALLVATGASAQVECGEEFLSQLKPGRFTICKVAPDTPTEFDFTVEVEKGNPAAPPPLVFVENPVLQAGECQDVYQPRSGPNNPADLVTINEIVPTGFELENICVLSIDRDGVITSHEIPEDEFPTVQGQIDANKDGCVAIYTNELFVTEGCRWTGGLNDTFDTGNGVNRYTGGGQTGANTALPPQPKGEWTHTQHSGPAGSFTFHGGTASAPAGSEIDEIRCSDPGGCEPSGEPPSPLKQLDFDGIGTFKNIGKKNGKVPDFVLAGANATAEGHGNTAFDGTFHWFEVNIDDDGEPGNSNPKKNPDDADSQLCPPNGFGEKGDQVLANCGCSDFYRISIYDGVDAADVVRNEDGSIDPASMNRDDVIYEVFGYIDGGNLQIHKLTGFDQKNL